MKNIIPPILLIGGYGSVGSHDIIIEISGILENGITTTLHQEVIHPHGQAHMTALGSVIILEQIIGLIDHVPPNFYLGANLMNTQHLKQRLQEQETLFFEQAQ